MNCLKCGRPLESSGHSCYWKIETPSYYNNDKEIYKLVQKMVLYEDMIEELKYLYDKLLNECFKEDAQDVCILLNRAEKLK